MQKNNERIDELFSRKIGDMEVTPPENGWQRIQQELDSQKRSSFKFWMAAASIALLMGTIATIMYVNTSNHLNPADAIAVVEQGQPQQTEETTTQILSNNNNNNNTPQTLQTPTTVSENHPLKTETAAETNSSYTQPSQNQQNTAVDSKTPVYFDTPIHREQRQALNTQRLAVLVDRFATKPAVMPLEKNRPVIMASTLPVYNSEWNPFEDEEKTKTQPKNKWEISGQFAPTYSYRSITSVPSNMKRADFDEAESALLAYSGGVNVAYSVASRFSVQVGVFYTQMGQSVNGVTTGYNMYAAVSSNNTYSKNTLRTSSGTSSVTSSMKADVNENYANYFNENAVQGSLNNSVTAKSSQSTMIERLDYIEIPMLMRYKLIDKKFDFILLGGGSTNILINNNVFLDNGKETLRDGSIAGARNFNYNTTVGFGMNYQLSGSLLIGIEPVFKYFLQSYTKDNTVGSHPYSFGLFTGVYYSF
ncbi:MAG: hypothetical protein LBN37_03025 [Bacteroidales bacterium]|jgi:hypothetical protein|nr:hypothetical protein [Bacteroidales bacterium]